MVLSLRSCKEIGQRISEVTNKPFSIDHHRAVSGGDINQNFHVSDSLQNQSYFVKVNHANRLSMFAAEVVCLNTIKQSGEIRVPAVIVAGEYESISFLVLEYLPLNAHGDEFMLGQQLASMHRVTAPQFGFYADNFIGSTPQKNTLNNNWCDFWRDCRLLPQLKLACANGYERQLKIIGNQLLKQLPEFFGDYNPEASLVHGDLWSGNKAYLSDETPVIFDPACYYGDREVDIAMTYLFGGFGQKFYQGYESQWPLQDGYKQREALYNLYHQLNHLNLFGDSYLRTCMNTINTLL